MRSYGRFQGTRFCSHERLPKPVEPRTVRSMRAFPLCVVVLLGLTACASGGGSRAPTPAPGASARENSGTADTSPEEMPYGQRVMAVRSYLDAGSPKRAAEVARTAIEQKPQRPEAHQLLGRALALQQQLAASARHYEAARARGADNRRLVVELGSVYDVTKAYSKAISLYREWLGKTPDDTPIRHQLGLTLLLTGNTETALAELERSHRDAPQKLQFAQDLAYAYLAAGQPAAAEKTAAAVIEAAPERTDAVRFLAKARIAQGELEQALEALNAALARIEDAADVRALRARLRLLLGDAAGAWQDYDMLLQQHRDNADLLLGGAGSLIATGALERASELIERAAKTAGDHPLVRLRRAQIAWHRGNAEALARMHALARAQPDNPQAWRVVLDAAQEADNTDIAGAAREHLEKLGFAVQN